MKHQVIKGLLFGTLVFFASCYYDNEETLYPPTECMTENMSYQADIIPILESNCYVCHSAAANLGNITLEGYSEVKKYVDSGQLMGAINHEQGFFFMPKDAPQLNECTIEKIEAWISDGAPDN